MPELRALERWMQASIVHPGTIEEAIRSRAATRHVPLREAERAILPSKTMAPLERLAVYQGMYPLRMHDALAADYPGLRAFLGHHLFEHFVADYVAVHPSRSYTLNRLGDHVPDFVKTWHHPKRAFLADLARLELAVTETFDAEDDAAPAAPPAHVDSDWESRRFGIAPTLRLLAFRHAAGPALDALKAGRKASTRPKASWAAVHRRSFVVYRLDLSRGEFHLLAALAAGESLGKALRLAARKARSPLSPAAVRKAFRIWTSEGILRA
ncbi:MAG: putative DNA-binding domain-containing protein [Acidobacteria bacterium]|nr:putative DNA-binding domain-containing protein [Acidobacteriota bacterium]